MRIGKSFVIVGSVVVRRLLGVWSVPPRDLSEKNYAK